MIRKEIKDQLDNLVCLLKKQYNDQMKESLFNRLFMMSLGFPQFTDVKCHEQLGIQLKGQLTDQLASNLFKKKLIENEINRK